MRLIWIISVFVPAAAFFNNMYGEEVLPVYVTPENLKDFQIIENIIVRDTGRNVVTVVVTFEDENSAEELHSYFRFRARQKHSILAEGRLSISSYPLFSDNEVLLFYLHPDLVEDSYLWYYNFSEERSIIFRLSEWRDKGNNDNPNDDDQDEASDGSTSGAGSERATSDPVSK